MSHDVLYGRRGDIADGRDLINCSGRSDRARRSPIQGICFTSLFPRSTAGLDANGESQALISAFDPLLPYVTASIIFATSEHPRW
jgi:hypothetical protein